VEKSPASPRFAFIMLLAAALRPCADKLADNAVAILFAFAYARLISHVTRLSGGTPGAFQQKGKEKQGKRMGKKRTSGGGRKQKGLRKTADARRRRFATIRSRSATLCRSLSLSLSLSPPRTFLLLLFAATNLRNVDSSLQQSLPPAPDPRLGENARFGGVEMGELNI